jgi:type II secretion system protein I
MKQKLTKQLGFTLLEVMIAVTIMTVAFAAILSSQSSSIILTMKTKEMIIAEWLANNVINETDLLYSTKSFSELPKEELAAFPAPFERFTWKREVKELKFPELNFSTNQDDKQQGQTDTLRMLTQMITKYLNESVRELVVTISWERGKQTYNVKVSTYLVNLNSEFNFGL